MGVLPMSMEETRLRITEEMGYLPDRFERFSYIVDIGKTMDPLPPEFRTETFQIEGCQSQLWLVPALDNGICRFRADSDSAIVKGIAAIICLYYSEETPEAILTGDVRFLEAVGIDQHLSSNRRNGLGKVDERIKRFAKSCLDADGQS
jgi:cysteine desulfuration protein SufE